MEAAKDTERRPILPLMLTEAEEKTEEIHKELEMLWQRIQCVCQTRDSEGERNAVSAPERVLPELLARMKRHNESLTSAVDKLAIILRGLEI